MIPLRILQPRRRKHKRKKPIDEHLEDPKKPYKLSGKDMIMRCSLCRGVGHNTKTVPKKTSWSHT